MFLRVHLETELPCSADVAWQQVLRSDLLKDVSWPLICFSELAGEPLPETWKQGSTVRVRCWLLGIIPLAIRTLFFERIDDDARQLQTREHDRMIPCWDHTIEIREVSDRASLYADTVNINAGVLTPLVWLFAQWFYRHRQRRWIRIAKRVMRTAA